MASLSFFSTLSGIAENAKQIAKNSNINFEDHELSHVDLVRLLESNSETGKSEALHFIIVQMMHGEDVSVYFPDVVKLVVSENPEIRRLVHIYLTHYAEFNPDLALLCVNTIQKTLYDKNPLVRATAIRVMSSIRVPAINGIVLLGIQQCMNDSSPLVRQGAALAILKCYSLDPSYYDQLVECIRLLLLDSHPLVVPVALAAFEEVCPDNFAIFHPAFRRICILFSQFSDWDKTVTLKTMIRYARLNLPKPESSSTIHKDLKLLLESVDYCFYSLLPSTVLAGCRAYYYLAPTNELHTIVKPLLQLLSEKLTIRFTTLLYIRHITFSKPELFKGYLNSFFLFGSDDEKTSVLKLQVISHLLDPENANRVLPELFHYVFKHPISKVASTAVRTIGHFAKNARSMTPLCLNSLLRMLKSENDLIVTEAASSLRILIHNDPQETYLQYLASIYEKFHVPLAKAVTLWLISEHLQETIHVAPDLLRIAVKTFANENLEVKYQILDLAVKLYVATLSSEQENEDSNPAFLLYKYVLSIIHFDMSYDLRDRARYYKSLTSAPLTDFTRRILLSSKQLVDSTKETSQSYCLGTTSLCLEDYVQGYVPIPEWADVSILPQDDVRDTEMNINTISSAGPFSFQNTDNVKSLSSETFTEANPYLTSAVKPRFVGQQSLEEFYKSDESSDSEEYEEEESTSEEVTEESEEEENGDDNDGSDDDYENESEESPKKEETETDKTEEYSTTGNANTESSILSTESIVDKSVISAEQNLWRSE
ncbi:AP-3 adaptor complex subunit Apl6 [Schizosaccharomyces cryophilus OY26]|uniref:AP-3 adaptor complex subunit Apl6 n=1 Tax=Schizosaccharomyces cryophilus (strain OY26 / ATCC MYA-4695 / CBS 11777 / NBRC 106824 / NRRL Y48691) TaxID=653667 RepID=S9X5Q1_SCHCR|nr:AP-3 adaptor complex subunit Apl6 [Schizosaccharomyces cryophilus OY26]EPY52372.1 AP-3 adaptor complex subunit Apl6 [Schizosaccharomyces cryophilus OY26]